MVTNNKDNNHGLKRVYQNGKSIKPGLTIIRISKVLTLEKTVLIHPFDC
jgi:hypothetical protein